jgi:hypothetical protein
MSKFRVRVIREVTQFVDLVVDASDASGASSLAEEEVRGGRADHLCSLNERPFDGWDVYVNREDVEPADEDVPVTVLAPESVDDSGSPSSVDRATRIEALAKMYESLTGESLLDGRKLLLASMIADARHWCDVHCVDFHAVSDLSYAHYVEERQSASVDLRPISFSGGLRSLSDDDLCSDCKHCQYEPGGMSACEKSFPGQEDADGYVKACPDYAK